MSVLAIRAGRLLTPLVEMPDGVVVVEDGTVVAAAPREALSLPAHAREYDARPWTLVPGFVDIHIHGAGGHDLMETNPAALAVVAATVARFGTTTIVATTVTAPEDDTISSLRALAQAASLPPRSDAATPAAELVGIHLEGPFISRTRRGVHPQASIVPPSLALLDRFLEAAGGAARILTLAPELPGALDLIDRARSAGLVAAIGHTDATYEQAAAAIDRGARHAVHVFNAMRPFSHRDTGVIGAVLTRPEISAEVIADGVHVDRPALELLLKAKGVAQVILASDGTAATAMPDGSYRLGMFDMTVSGGVCRDGQGRLAGSTLTLDRAVIRVAGLGVPLADAVRMATLNPARRLGLEPRKGMLAPGADADLVLLDEALRVAAVMTRGMSEPARVS
ncbi:MAG TPA: N-acetylglucosamine-6-phosphate deacetylase [Candidatus Acidoferrales bacterium]|nr:N-acetylglucosamine-6-phosphate deacetylase [Candidatus Acidoferrales bacterium]